MQEANDEYILLYSRIAEAIKPDHIDAVIMSAELLEQMDRHDLAIEALK